MSRTANDASPACVAGVPATPSSARPANRPDRFASANLRSAAGTTALLQLVRHPFRQLGMQRQLTIHRSMCPDPVRLVRMAYAIPFGAAVAPDLPTDRRRRPAQRCRDRANGLPGYHRPRDVFPLGQAQRPNGATSRWRSNAAGENPANGGVLPIKQASNLVQRLALRHRSHIRVFCASVYRIRVLLFNRNTPAALAASHVLHRSYETTVESGRSRYYDLERKRLAYGVRSSLIYGVTHETTMRGSPFARGAYATELSRIACRASLVTVCTGASSGRLAPPSTARRFSDA